MSASKPNYLKLPEHLRDGMQLYLEHGIVPGGCLTAILSDQFLEAFKRADATTTACMAAIADFVYNDVPMEACGSEAKVRAWVKRHAEARELEEAK